MFGRRFRLNATTICTTHKGGKAVAEQIPKGVEVVVLNPVAAEASKDSNRQVWVEWEGRIVSMFLVDLQERGEPIPSQGKRKST